MKARLQMEIGKMVRSMIALV